MNTYLIPVFDGNDIWIHKIDARNINDAKDKFIDDFIMDEDEIPANFEEFKKKLEENEGWKIGSFYEIDEF